MKNTAHLAGSILNNGEMGSILIIEIIAIIRGYKQNLEKSISLHLYHILHEKR